MIEHVDELKKVVAWMNRLPIPTNGTAAQMMRLQRVIDALSSPPLPPQRGEQTDLNCGTWQPIETAPKGETVLVYSPPTTHDWPDSVRIEFDYIDPDSDGNHWYHHGERYEHYCCVAKPEGSIGLSEKAPYTHWMRLPAAPGAAAVLPQGVGAKLTRTFDQLVDATERNGGFHPEFSAFEVRALIGMYRGCKLKIERLEFAAPAGLGEAKAVAPESWKLVPSEPTPNMLANAIAPRGSYSTDRAFEAETTYRLMLAAAPVSPSLPPAAESAGGKDALDAKRWRETLRHIGGRRANGGQQFTLSYLPPVMGNDIMHGSVAGHFTEAIDTAIAAMWGEKP